MKHLLIQFTSLFAIGAFSQLAAATTDPTLCPRNLTVTVQSELLSFQIKGQAVQPFGRYCDYQLTGLETSEGPGTPIRATMDMVNEESPRELTVLFKVGEKHFKLRSLPGRRGVLFHVDPSVEYGFFDREALTQQNLRIKLSNR